MNKLRAALDFFVVLLGVLSFGVLVGCSTEILPPRAVATVDPAEVAVGATVRLDGSTSDDPQDLPLYFEWSFTEVPAGSAAEIAAAATAKPYFVADVAGTYIVALVVSNGTLTSERVTTEILAGPCGTNLPVVDAIAANPAAPNIGQAVALTAEVSDADAAAPCDIPRVISRTWHLSKVPPGSKATLDFPDVDEPFFTPDLDGAYAVTLVATDELGRASAPFTLEIAVGTCGSQAPTVDAIAATPTTPATGQVVQLGATISDPDIAPPCGIESPISYSWSIVAAPAGSDAKLNLPNGANPSFTADRPGDYVVELVVTDGAGKVSEAGSLIITATGCGDGVPVIGTVMSSPVSPAIGQTVQLTAAFTDADGIDPCNLAETVSFAWTLVGQPAGSVAALNNPVADSPSFVPDVDGDYTITLVLTDSQGHVSLPGQVVITASTCGKAPPTALIEEITPTVVAPGNAVIAPDTGVNDTVQLSAVASTDADNAPPCSLGQSLSYAWSFLALPAGSTTKLNDPTVVNPSFVTDVPGTYVIGLTVTDSAGVSSSLSTFTITADPAAGVGVPVGFTITTVAAGPLYNGARGVTKDDANNIYVVEGSGRLLKIPPVGFTEQLTAGGFLQGAQDVTFDITSQQLFVSTGLGVIARVTLSGVQTQCVGGQGANYRGIDVYTGTGGLRLMVADQNTNRIQFYDPATCTQQSTNNFGGNGNLNNPWGVTARLLAGVDTVFTSDNTNETIWRNTGGAYATDTGTNTLISNSFVISEPRDLVASPCPTPKLILANRDGANLLLFANAANVQPGVIVTGLQSPFGLHFEDANNLLVTDESADAVFRITGPFCSL